MGDVEESLEWRRSPWLRKVSHWIVWTLARVVWRLKVSGLENVPREGPLILAGNHVSIADGPLMGMAAAPKRYMRGMGKQELFKVPLLGWWLRNTGQVPLDRSGDVSAMRWAIDLLRSGGCVGLLPEGTRSKDGKRGRPKAGVGFLAGQTGALVVPTRFINTDKFPKPVKLEVRFGPPLRFEGDPGDRKTCLEFAQKVMDRVFEL
ncbi:MAG: 1-acyl-sn-glycerol-3-phosphate acyltransferase [Elusimicrobia bacterium]|nr:1-acyl-sn-glycerol-3-phosphate acyltransferase [Elusimicrobiota bacterium]